MRRRGARGGWWRRMALLKHSFPDQEFVFLVTMPGALIDRARDEQPAPKATRLFFNVRKLKKLINDVMRPSDWVGEETTRTHRVGLRERFTNRTYLLTERPTRAVGITLCFPNDGRSFGKYCTTQQMTPKQGYTHPSSVLSSS